MTQPLALVFYERLLPGTQLVNRLQDLGYRVQTSSTVESLVTNATEQPAMLVVADLVSRKANVSDAIAQLQKNSATKHLPVLAFADDKNAALQNAARAAGATIVVNESAILTHLEQFLEQALALD